jgi:hypothetical protein
MDDLLRLVNPTVLQIVHYAPLLVLPCVVVKFHVRVVDDTKVCFAPINSNLGAQMPNIDLMGCSAPTQARGSQAGSHDSLNCQLSIQLKRL